MPQNDMNLRNVPKTGLMERGAANTEISPECSILRQNCFKMLILHHIVAVNQKNGKIYPLQQFSKFGIWPSPLSINPVFGTFGGTGGVKHPRQLHFVGNVARKKSEVKYSVEMIDYPS
jgi:hypothetical protein